MGTDKTINLPTRWGYLRHLWAAKGRHGTHSPFVYAFVEHVLRDKPFEQGFPNKGNVTMPEWNHLIKTITFLQAEHLGLYQSHLLSLKSFLTSVLPLKKVFVIDDDTIRRPNTLLLIDAPRLCERDLDYLKGFQTESPFSLYFLRPHEGLFGKKERFRDWKNYPMSLDFWDGVLLCQHPDFKQKQHFLLR